MRWYFSALFRFLFLIVPVVRCREGCHHYILPVDVDDICHSLQDVEVKVGVTRDGAVQTRLEKWGPLLLQDTRRAATVILTNPGHPGKHHLTNTHNSKVTFGQLQAFNSYQLSYYMQDSSNYNLLLFCTFFFHVKILSRNCWVGPARQ